MWLNLDYFQHMIRQASPTPYYPFIYFDNKTFEKGVLFLVNKFNIYREMSNYIYNEI